MLKSVAPRTYARFLLPTTLARPANPLPPPTPLLPPQEGKVQLHTRAAAAPGGFKQTYAPAGEDGPIKVSLHDCLACSGCVTTAETVLLAAQSAAELSAKLTEPGAVVVVSVSPQSRASLAGTRGGRAGGRRPPCRRGQMRGWQGRRMGRGALALAIYPAAAGLPEAPAPPPACTLPLLAPPALHGLESSDVQARLTTALRRMGVAAVLDIGVAREMAVAETVEEFLQRWGGAQPAGAPAAGHTAGDACCSCTYIHDWVLLGGLGRASPVPWGRPAVQPVPAPSTTPAGTPRAAPLSPPLARARAPRRLRSPPARCRCSPPPAPVGFATRRRRRRAACCRTSAPPRAPRPSWGRS
jgi:hypothetical protein